MKSSLATIAVLTTTALTGAGAASAAAATPAATSSADHSSPRAELISCAGTRLSAPMGFDLFCGDGGDVLSHLRWSHWGSRSATARGELTVNTCEPDCAAGHDRTHHVTVTASDLVRGRYEHLRVGSERFDVTVHGPVLA